MCRWLKTQRESPHPTVVSAHLLRGPFLRMPDVRCQTPECEGAAFLQSADFFFFFSFFSAGRSSGACLQLCYCVRHRGLAHDTEQRLTAQHCAILEQRTISRTVLVEPRCRLAEDTKGLVTTGGKTTATDKDMMTDGFYIKVAEERLQRNKVNSYGQARAADCMRRWTERRPLLVGAGLF